ncbi:MAG: amidase family protein, partial [Dehalococcoidia bacterium]|nr:amidase family protein [Dehalococcoidia bacterium]
YGIKATQGRIPRRRSSVHSYFPLNNSSVGPLARDVRDCAVLLNVLSGPAPDAESGTISTPPPDYTECLARGVRGLRIAWSHDFGGAPVDHEIVDICGKAAKVFEELGAHVEHAEYKPDAPEAVFESFVTFSAAKTYTTHPDALQRRADLTDYFFSALERGRAVTGEQLFTAISNIGRYRAYTVEFLSRYDLLLSPTLAVGAFKIGHPPEAIGGKRVFSPRLGFYPFTYPFNATGNPAASIPCGFTKEGMPAGLQIIGRHEDEATVIAASAAFEQARPWAQHRPPVH